MKYQGLDSKNVSKDNKNLEFDMNTLSQTTNATDYAVKMKQFWYQYYFDLFVELTTSFFVYDGLPNDIPQEFIEKELLFNGYVALAEVENFGYYAISGSLGGQLNHYKQSLAFTPNNFGINDNIKFLDKYEPIYYKTEFTTWDYEKCIVLPNTDYYKPFSLYISMFAEKLAMIELSIHMNRQALNRPFAVVGDEKDMLSLENLFKDVINGNPVVKIKPNKTKEGNIDGSILDNLQVLQFTSTNFLPDLQDEKQRVIAQFLTRIGINNVSIDKKERLTHAESVSNSGLINNAINIRLQPRERYLNIFNELTGNNVSVHVNPFLMDFANPVIDEMNSEIDDGESGELGGEQDE